MKNYFTTRRIAMMAILIAADIVLTRILAYNGQLIRMTFNFVTHTLLGCLFGPIGAGFALFAGDIAGYPINPQGPFFIGFSFSAMVVGVLYGLFYYRKTITLPRAIAATLVITLIDSLILTPFWLVIMYQMNYWVLVTGRITKAIIMVPIQIVLTYWLIPRLMKISTVQKFILRA